MSVTKRESILRRNPYRDRRSFIARAMALEPIGDIADVSLTESSSLTWETATDWDNAVSETGIVHESVANTDHGDATLLKQGYSAASPLYSTGLVGYYPLHENTGSTACDFSGNDIDGTYTGATLGQTGVLGTTAPNFDGVGDDVEIPVDSALHDGGQALSVSVWFNADALPANDYGSHLITKTPEGGGDGWWQLRLGANGGAWYLKVGGANYFATFNTTFTTGTWYHVGGTYNGASAKTYLNGSPKDSNANMSGDIDSGASDKLFIGQRSNDSRLLDGRIADVRIWDQALTDSDMQAIYDVVNTTDSLTVATKSFSAATKPDLQNLSYNLNTETISLDVIGSPGTASEEIVTQTLGGATSYSLTWANSHTDFRVRINLSTSDVTTTATVNRVELA